MLRVFISVPMSGRSNEEVLKQIEDVKRDVLENHIYGDEEIMFVDNLEYEPKSLLEANPVIPNLLYLGQAVKKMGMCNAVVFAPGWDNARGCRIEFDVAIEYGLPRYFAK